eukprot:CAMPEP_0175955458 /NCGR_PEP_ID=MMETSP0108-20121206/32513_1 /TAXON_ID=195067 ORGANISM="Goniomonas pacifica, Strain CCMP1869" /NCGR_SAMPLE_ID=MMETSP0108 /ASSEMBLY_ACC=CAM_ASM_000204 /LENGTH=89 /DNA_ID=CAMNT_0017282323 /DNA_START=29 /DNA_END=294 /DNA_ORIENTATION=-
MSRWLAAGRGSVNYNTGEKQREHSSPNKTKSTLSTACASITLTTAAPIPASGSHLHTDQLGKCDGLLQKLNQDEHLHLPSIHVNAEVIL